MRRFLWTSSRSQCNLFIFLGLTNVQMKFVLLEEKERSILTVDLGNRWREAVRDRDSARARVRQLEVELAESEAIKEKALADAKDLQE